MYIQFLLRFTVSYKIGKAIGVLSSVHDRNAVPTKRNGRRAPSSRDAGLLANKPTDTTKCTIHINAHKVS